MVGPGCVLGEWIRAWRPAERARRGGLTGACWARIEVLLGFGWSGPQLERPTPLTYRYGGRDVRLTDVHGDVLHRVVG